ncbi:MAG: hypothetical protein RI957_182 [Verrucomicrobiota bacterium]|jgi:hypothetical protein
MTFFSIKCAIISIALGAAIAACGYLLSTASYVGTANTLILQPKVTDSGTMWTAENDELAVEVRYITSVIETPAIAIRKKQQWRKLAISMTSGMLLAYACFRLMMRKAPVAPDIVLPQQALPPSEKQSDTHELS